MRLRVLVQVCFGVPFAGDAAGAFLRDWWPGCLGCCSGCYWMLVTAQARVCEIDGRAMQCGVLVQMFFAIWGLCWCKFFS